MRIYLFFTLFFSSICATPFTYSELKMVNDKMFAYHVLFDSYNANIADRSVKKIFDFLDPVKFYFLESENQIALQNYEEFVEEYNQNNFYRYDAIHNSFVQAVKRCRKVRSEVRSDIINGKINIYGISKEVNRNSPATEKEQKQYIIEYMCLHIQNYLEEIGKPSIDREMITKILNFYEKKMISHEENYLSKNRYPLVVAKSIASSLDAHSMVYAEEEILGFNISLKNQFEGIGIYVSDGIDGPQISGCIKGGPAERSGLIESGCRIKFINGIDTQGVPFNRIMKMLSIKGGEKIFLVIEGAAGKRTNVKLIGEKISVRKERISIHREDFLDGHIVQLQINSFYDDFQGGSMSEDLRKTITQLKKEKPVYGIIIDMRNNLGGFFKEAVKSIALFCESETVVIAKFKNNQIRYSREYNPHISYIGPVIILTSRYSASAAEILAQSLQDVGAAIIAGDETTYGKGSIQFQTITDPNSDLKYKVTVGKYYTISGASTQMKGVHADIVVPSKFSRLNVGERYLRYALPEGDIKTMQGVSSELKPVFEHYQSRNLTVYEVMKSQLKKNSQKRIKDNKNYQAFLRNLGPINVTKGNIGKKNREEKFGKNDLPMQEATYIIKDMHAILRQYQ